MWKSLGEGADTLSTDRALRGGVVEHADGKLRVALNRPPSEDTAPILNEAGLEELFSGLDWRLIARTLENEKSLTSEVWRTFLMLMAAAIVFEALLCLPRKRPAEEPVPELNPQESA